MVLEGQKRRFGDFRKSFCELDLASGRGKRNKSPGHKEEGVFCTDSSEPGYDGDCHV